MPEGPIIIILKEKVEKLNLPGQRLLEISGDGKTDYKEFVNQKVTAIKSWGKHFLICFSELAIRVHMMMDGFYQINSHEHDKQPTLRLVFPSTEINFYDSSIILLKGDLDDIYDWKKDIMSDSWDEEAALKKLIKNPATLVCDVLLDQQVFSGSGNIIKNEALYRVKVHPLSLIGELPPAKLREMIEEVRNYSFDFLKWKKELQLAKKWQAYTKETCMRCNVPLLRAELGKTKRLCYYCTNCQQLYSNQLFPF